MVDINKNKISIKSKAIFYDGLDSVHHEIEVEIGSNGVILHPDCPEGRSQQWNCKRVRFVEETHKNNIIKLANLDYPDARLVIEDLKVLQYIKKYPLLKKQSAIKKLLILIGAVVVSSFFLISISSFFYSNFIVSKIPYSLEKKILFNSNKDFLEGKTVCHNKEGQKAIDKIVHRLTKNIENKRDFKIHIINESQIGALSFFTGDILLYKGIISKVANESELAGIIAHELSHVEKRHHLKNVVRKIFLYPFVMAIGGDYVLELLVNSKNSREKEIEADEYGVKLLEEAGFDPNGLGNFFRNIENLEIKPTNKHKFSLLKYLKSRPFLNLGLGIDENSDFEKDITLPASWNSKLISQYTANHPMFKDRLTTKVKKSDKVVRVLTDEEWSNIKKICN